MKQGFYVDMTEDKYYSDMMFGSDSPPTLNASTLKILIEERPVHAWLQHPRLNPDYEAKHSAQFDLARRLRHTSMAARTALPS